MFEVDVRARDLSPYVELLGRTRVAELTRKFDDTRKRLASRTIWNVSSTAAGGGVAEMLHPQLGYALGQDVHVRWAIVEGPPEFFAITKRVHNALHDSAGDGSPLGPAEAALYRRVTEENARELERRVAKGDIVICHDPQTAGLIPTLLAAGVQVVWRCHIGHEGTGAELEKGWEFLRPYLWDVPIAVFSRDVYVPRWLPRTRAVTLPPTVDPFSLKNRWLPERTVLAILAASGIVAADGIDLAHAAFVRDDGTRMPITNQVLAAREGAPPRHDVPLVLQISRWDRMKDHVGVLEAFTRVVRDAPDVRAELVLAGPVVGGVADDPEAGEVLQEVDRAFRDAKPAVRSRVHVVQIPMVDLDENAAIVNALQRHATVIVQKSLYEGFGLVVTEAMWKARPVIASAVGGIQDQISDGVSGLLLRDPSDPEEASRAIVRVLRDPEFGERMGAAAHRRVLGQYLMIGSLERWADLMGHLVRMAA